MEPSDPRGWGRDPPVGVGGAAVGMCSGVGTWKPYGNGDPLPPIGDRGPPEV